MSTTPRAARSEEAYVRTTNGLLEAFVDISVRHRRPLGASEVVRRIPHDASGLKLETLLEVAPDFGFEARLVEMTVGSIPAIALPAILLDREGRAMVLTALSTRRGEAAISVPGAGIDPQIVSLDRLAHEHSGTVVFVKPVATAGTEPDPAGASAHGQRHWFWSTFRCFWRDYTQVVVAALLINVLGLATPLFIKNVYDRVIPNLAIPTLWALASGVALALLLDAVLRLVRTSIVDATGRRVDLAVAGRLFDHMLRLRLEARPRSTGGLASQLRDFDLVRDVLTSSTIVALTDLAFIGVFVAVLWLLVGPLALVPAVAVVVVLAAAGLVQLPLARAVSASQIESARRHGILVEAASSIETIKTIGAEPHLRRDWNAAVAATSRSTADARHWAALSTHIVAFVSQAVAVITVVWGVFLVLDGTITVGGLIAASILSSRIIAPLASIVQTLARALQAWSAFRALDGLMRQPVELATASGGPRPRAGELCFRDVSFTYPAAGVAALDGVSFTIALGEKVGLIGRIGSGKTSVGRLVAGLYQPTSGQILIDGMDIRQFGADIRSVVGFCQQETELFSGTLGDNIAMAMAQPDAGAIERAARIAGVDAFAARHPAGLALPVAERGRSLSGGQRQAIGIARVLVRDPAILFLDEPSSAMDTASERGLVQRLKQELKPDLTLLVSTHRDGLLDLVDRLLVFDGGRLVMDGPKAEVLARLRDAARPVPPPPSSGPLPRPVAVAGRPA